MDLTEIFYGKFIPPTESNVRRNCFGLTGGQRYVPPKQPFYKRKDLAPQDRLIGSYKKIFNVIKAQTKPISSTEMSKKVPWTRNHCSLIMAELYKRGLVKRFKQKYQQTRIYMYFIEKENNDA